MSLTAATAASGVIQTLENYSVVADNKTEVETVANNSTEHLYADEQFWRRILQNPAGYWNKRFDFEPVIVSDWVARVPGLFWLKASGKYRNVPDSAIEMHSENWVMYKPQAKSSIVLGGVGDFVLPPDDDGKTVMMLSFTGNASTGIPALFFPEVIEQHDIKQGDKLVIKKAPWRKMSAEWSSRFQSIAELGRGYLVIDDPAQVKVERRDQPVEIHPCSIMQYNNGAAILYDFVFCTTDTLKKDYRKGVSDFFKDYGTRNGRLGKYLVAADSNEPLFDSLYNSPADLLKTEPDGRSQLQLMVERVQNSFYHNGATIDSILEEIPKLYNTADEIAALALSIGIPPALIQVAPAAKMSTQLVQLCIERKILESLVDQMHNK